MYRPAAGLWRDLYEPLLDTGVHPLRYVLRAWPRAMWPTFAVALVLTLLCQLLGLDPFSGEDPRRLLGSEPKGRLLLKVVLFAPLAETLLMAPMLALLMRLWRGRRLPAALSSAAAWGLPALPQRLPLGAVRLLDLPRVLHRLAGLEAAFLRGTPSWSPPRSTPCTIRCPAWR